MGLLNHGAGLESLRSVLEVRKNHLLYVDSDAMIESLQIWRCVTWKLTNKTWFVKLDSCHASVLNHNTMNTTPPYQHYLEKIKSEIFSQSLYFKFFFLILSLSLFTILQLTTALDRVGEWWLWLGRRGQRTNIVTDQCLQCPATDHWSPLVTSNTMTTITSLRPIISNITNLRVFVRCVETVSYVAECKDVDVMRKQWWGLEYHCLWHLYISDTSSIKAFTLMKFSHFNSSRSDCVKVLLRFT